MSSGYYQEQRFEFARPPLTLAVQRLILLNAIIFALQLACTVFFGDVARSGAGVHVLVAFDFVAFRPSEFLTGFLWQPLTYMFLHGGLSHLFFNMLILFFFGPDVERVLGTQGFYRFFVICGALAVLASLVPALLFGSNASVVGASGAVMAVLMAAFFINPERQLYLFPFPFPINMRALICIVIAMEVLRALSVIDAGGVSVATHIGGLLAGWGVYQARGLLPKIRIGMGGGSGAQRKARKPKKGAGKPRKEDLDRVGREVDNIFKFDDRRR